MINFKKAAAGVLAAGMILSLTACDEESGTTVSGSGTSNAAPDANANAVVTTPLVTTTYDTDPAVIDAAKEASASLDNPDLKVDKRIKWMAWWDIDETTAAAEMFKSVYGVPAAGDDPSREGQDLRVHQRSLRRTLRQAGYRYPVRRLPRPVPVRDTRLPLRRYQGQIPAR